LRSLALRSNKIFSALQASSGSFFEAYDLIVFGSFAGVIGSAFFPSNSKYTSLMFGFMTFAAAYVMRVAGALVLGPYLDRAGRRKGLMLSLALIAFGTGVIAFSPTYKVIGVLAPILMLTGRLIQGFSIGGETGGVTAYLVEVAAPNRNALYVSWNSICFHLAALSAISLEYVLHKMLKAGELAVWGWRLPFIVGCGVIPLVFFMRSNLVESEDFLSRDHHLSMSEILVTLLRNWQFVLAGMFMVVLGSSIFYFILTYMPIFSSDHLHLATNVSLVSTIYVSAYCVIAIPLFAIVSDRVGRRPMLLTSAALVVITAYPFLKVLTISPSFWTLMLVQFWYATLYAMYVSSAFVALSELIPAELRATGYGLSTTLGLALFGGFTPAVSEWLVHITGDNAIPSLWLIVLAICSTVASWLLFRGQIAIKMSTVNRRPDWTPPRIATP